MCRILRLLTSSSKSLSCSLGSMPPTYTLAACDHEGEVLVCRLEQGLSFGGVCTDMIQHSNAPTTPRTTVKQLESPALYHDGSSDPRLGLAQDVPSHLTHRSKVFMITLWACRCCIW